MPPCPNCGDTTQGRFCPSCGQRRGERRITLRRLLADVFEDQFSLSGALPRTMGVLLFKPGRLTTDYMAGRIARYVPPFRLYLLSSFVFFLVLNLLGGGPQITRNATPEVVDSAAIAADTAVAGDSISVAADTAGITISTDFVPDTAQGFTPAESERMRVAIDSLVTGIGFLPERARERVRERLFELSQLEQGRLGAVISRELLDRAPVAIFLLLPVYAAILALLYVRSRRYYVEHFVFALHIHAFVFLLFTLQQFVERWDWLSGLMGLWIMVYGLLALRRYYRQSIPKTLVKYVLLGAIYLPLLTVVMAGVLIYALMVMPV